MNDRAKGLIAVPALMTVLLSACASSQQTVNNNQRLERFTRPAVVTVLDGCRGNYVYPIASGSKNSGNPNFENSGTLISGSVGSGYFVNQNGYIVTNAHVTQYANDKENGTKKCREDLLKQFAEKLAPNDEKNPNNEKKQKGILDKLRGNPENYQVNFEEIR